MRGSAAIYDILTKIFSSTGPLILELKFNIKIP